MSALVDIGSLATVKNEIDQSFRYARELLAGCLGHPETQRPLQQAQSCLHQAAGALKVIGLEGAARIAFETEVFVGMMARRAIELTPAHLHLGADAITILSSYLDGLAEGAPDRPLSLFPHYEALQRARGLTDVSPADLFFPDTSRLVDIAGLPVRSVADHARCEYLKNCRQAYEQGLAMWADPAHPAGLEHLRDAIAQIESVQTEAAARTFWRVAGCLMEGLGNGSIAANAHLQQIAVRLGLQIRKQALCTPDDAGKEPLLRSMLYYLAQCRHADTHIAGIRQLFQLEDQLSGADLLHPAPQADLRLQCRLRGLLETLMRHWSGATAGETGQADAFRLGCQQLVADLPALAQQPLTLLAAQVLATAQALDGQEIPEPLALEMAATMLLIDLAIEHSGLLSAEFPALAAQQGERLQQAAAGQPMRAAPAQWLALLGPAVQRARDLMLLRQVTEAVRSNLQAAGSSLDAIAPLHGAPDALLPATALLHQVAGAFDILAYDRPALLARRCMTRLEQVKYETDAVTLERRLEAVAEGIAALDLYVIALQHVQPNHDHWLETGLARLAQDVADLPAPPPRRPGAEPRPSEPAGTSSRRGKVQPTRARAAAPDRIPPAPAVAPSPDTAPLENQELTIGPIHIPAELFTLFLQEAAANLSFLATSFQAITERSEPVSYDMMRAAHTLTGIARTVQCPPIADISRALEIRLHQLLDADQSPGRPDQELICKAQAAIADMVAAFAASRYPAAAPELVAALQLAAREPARTMHVQAAAAGTQTAEAQANAPAEFRAAAGVAAAPAPLPDETAISDAIDAQLLAIFLEEATELYPALCGDFRRWREQPDHPQLPVIMQRRLHTLKGSARMTGANRLGARAHQMESLLLEAGETPPTGDAFQQLEASLDQIGRYINELSPAITAPGRTAADATPARPSAQPAPAARAEAPPTRTVLRVAARVIDDLVNDAGEISINRASIQESLHRVAAVCSEMASFINRLQEQVRQVEIQAESRMQSRLPQDGPEQAFDPLELDRFTELHAAVRSMTDTISEAGAQQARLLHEMDRADEALRQQARTVRQLQQSLMRIRMTPFATITERFYQITRQVARELDKNVHLAIEGEQVEIDRSVLEAMTAPIEHLLRNAIAHGIETPELRRAAGKPGHGQITIHARSGRNEIILEITDDGAGLDIERLRRKAAERGLLPDAGSPPGSLIDLIFLPGFSTADSVTEISGRGLGMNVVQNEITALGGRIEVQSAPGQGAAFTIYLPLTLATMPVVLVRSGDELYAFPAVMVEQVQMHKKAELEALHAAGEICRGDARYPLYYLGVLIGRAPRPATWPLHPSVLLLENGHGRVAVHVDAIAGNQEVVVKNIGPQLARVPGLAGATVLANGREVVILNPIVLADELSSRELRCPLLSAPAAERPLTGAEAAAPSPGVSPAGYQASGGQDAAAPVTADPPRPLIMVVDDSLTVRKVTTGFLRRAGYTVISAKDGHDALSQMQAQRPALMLVDVEMPGMDGFDLTRHLRSDASTASLPIIMITSRTAEKHRNFALRLGVNAYLGKPYNEEALLQEIHRLLGGQL